jgi:hypothetical protein
MLECLLVILYMQGLLTPHAYLHPYLRFVVRAEITGLGKEIFSTTWRMFSKTEAKTNSLQL